MNRLTARLLDIDDSGIRTAAGIIREGGLVSFPTETVYGLGADAGNSRALDRLFAAKGRPSTNPLIVHLADAREVFELAEFDRVSQFLADKFWPGPLTVISRLKTGSGISRKVSAGLESVGFRVPSNEAARKLLAAVGSPVAAPSANLSNGISPTEPEHVIKDLGGRIDAILCGGSCSLGLESTVLRSMPTGIRVFRLGAISEEQIKAALSGDARILSNGGSIERNASPGQLPIHYAPRTTMRRNAIKTRPDEVRVGFGSHEHPVHFNLSEAGNLDEAAMNLYSVLRAADALAQRAGMNCIAVSPVTNTGIGRAINDRLARASGS